ncbi:hypothetical protein Bca52824_056892 [Brassica carinata]|uniref:Ubiquitin-like protease family profile domain-containing protein n=1 Tax=Brassica carinata TaxID=52824 RepID=A0A8X7UD60_BRACI|nr:hypothetical protein Bca52824_056892 [Brassica carinata]
MTDQYLHFANQTRSGEDIDDIYAPLNLDDKHWLLLDIDPKRHIVVWDSIPSSSVPHAWDAIMEPFLRDGPLSAC